MKPKQVHIIKTRCGECSNLRFQKGAINNEIEAFCDSHKESFYHKELVQFDFASHCQDFKEKVKG